MPPRDADPYLTLVLAGQRSLYAYILSLVGALHDADDLLQETNATLLRKRESFAVGTSFSAWAKRVAHFEVLAWRKRRRKEGHRCLLDDELFEALAGADGSDLETHQDRLDALETCLEQLSPRNASCCKCGIASNRSPRLRPPAWPGCRDPCGSSFFEFAYRS